MYRSVGFCTYTVIRNITTLRMQNNSIATQASFLLAFVAMFSIVLSFWGCHIICLKLYIIFCTWILLEGLSNICYSPKLLFVVDFHCCVLEYWTPSQDVQTELAHNIQNRSTSDLSVRHMDYSELSLFRLYGLWENFTALIIIKKKKPVSYLELWFLSEISFLLGKLISLYGRTNIWSLSYKSLS